MQKAVVGEHPIDANYSYRSFDGEGKPEILDPGLVGERVELEGPGGGRYEGEGEGGVGWGVGDHDAGGVEGSLEKRQVIHHPAEQPEVEEEVDEPVLLARV
uniref:Uncharacterized protein n=1 Tax=Pyramimonas obovata TaxID=1411642 RepID=A0A7S0N6E3_9CHLO